MAKNANLKNSVAQVVKTNGVKGITGANLQPTILQVIDKLGGGYQFGGLVQPNGTFPVDVNGNSLTDQNFAFLASTPGTYTNFGGLVVNDGEVCVLLWDGTWTKQVTGIVTASKMAEDYAKKVGSYAGLTAGISCGIADSISNGTPQEFTFRKSGGDGVNYMKRIKGKTTVWNQLVGAEDTEVTVPSGHVYVSVIGGTVARATSDGTPVAVTSGTDTIFDLTQMFGAGNEPATADAFFALFPDAPTAYNPGALISNDAAQVETAGFNRWDEEWENGIIDTVTGLNVVNNNQIRSKNFIPILPNKAYYASPGSAWCMLYDKNKQIISGDEWSGGTQSNNARNVGQTVFVTAERAAYMRFYMTAGYGPTYNHDICLNLSDPAKNGTYEPYWKRVLPLGLNSFRVTDGTNIITVNGLKSAGSVYDEIDPVRKKYIKRIGEVDLGTLGWEYLGASYATVYAADSRFFGGQRLVCAKYINGVETDKALYAVGGFLRVVDSAYSDAATFKAAMSGVMLYYELATPVEYDLVDEIPNAILVDALGTEEAIFPEHQDGTPSAPFCCDSNYSISVKNLVAALAALNASLGGGGE